jgi:nitrogen fixation-related uncharacterized protein
MPTEQEKFYGFMNEATAPVQWAVRQIKFWLTVLACIAILIVGVFGCGFWWVVGGYNADQEEANKYTIQHSHQRLVDFSVYYGSPKGDPEPDSTYCCDLSLRARLTSTTPCSGQPDLMGIRDERTKFLNWTSVGQGWSSEENGSLAMYRSYRRAKYNMEELCRFLRQTATPSVPQPDLSAAPIIRLYFSRASGAGRDGHIFGMCVATGPQYILRNNMWYEQCPPEDRVPAVGRFRTLTSGQQQAINLLESTLSDEFWVKVARANGITDTEAVKTAAKSSRKSVNEFDKD